MNLHNAQPTAASNDPRTPAPPTGNSWDALIRRPALIAFLALWFLLKVVLHHFIARDSTPLRSISPNMFFICHYLLLFAVGAVAFHHRASRAAHWVRDNKLRAVGTVIAGYIALQIAGWLAAYASQLLDPAGALGKVSLNDEAVARAVTERNGGAETLLLFATVAFIGPIVEEFFFRQFLIDFLDQYIPGWASLTISSALFGVYHMHTFRTHQRPSSYVAGDSAQYGLRPHETEHHHVLRGPHRQ